MAPTKEQFREDVKLYYQSTLIEICDENGEKESPWQMGQLNKNQIQRTVKRFEKFGSVETRGITVTSKYKQRLEVLIAQNGHHVEHLS